MKNDSQLKIEIQKEIRELAKTIHDLSMKYQEEPLMKDAQNVFLNLSLSIGKALDIPLQ